MKGRKYIAMKDPLEIKANIRLKENFKSQIRKQKLYDSIFKKRIHQMFLVDNMDINPHSLNVDQEFKLTGIDYSEVS